MLLPCGSCNLRVFVCLVRSKCLSLPHPSGMQDAVGLVILGMCGTPSLSPGICAGFWGISVLSVICLCPLIQGLGWRVGEVTHIWTSKTKEI